MVVVVVVVEMVVVVVIEVTTKSGIRPVDQQPLLSQSQYRSMEPRLLRPLPPYGTS